LEGDEVKLRIAPGTANGKTFRVKGRGVKKGVNAGDLMVSIEVQVPRSIDERQRKVLLEMASLEDKLEVRANLRAQSKT
jgi:molecular chaperone DnaJ